MKQIAICIFLLLGLVLIGCTGGGGGGGGDTGDGDEVVPPNPNGVLLDDDPESLAVEALYRLLPTPVEPEDIVDGVILSRLSVVLDPDATVGEVNAALQATGTRISSMLTGDPSITLRMEPAESQEEADAIAATVEAEDAFLLAFKGLILAIPDTSLNTPLSNSNINVHSVLPELENKLQEEYVHKPLQVMRFPAAWSTRRFAQQQSQKMSVLLLDHLGYLEPHPQIPGLTLHEGGGLILGGAYTIHGFQVAGIIAAKNDAIAPIGVHPEPADLLDIHVYSVGYIEIVEALQLIAEMMPNHGKFVLNISMGYPTGEGQIGNDWTDEHCVRVLHDALCWRRLVADRANRFLLAVAVGYDNNNVKGNPPDGTFDSPWSMAQRFDHPRDLLTTYEATRYKDPINRLWEDTIQQVPAAASRLKNTLSVASSSPEGKPMDWSTSGGDIHALGQTICVYSPENPNGTTACTGNSFATPTITGLAAYMWNLDPTLSVADLREKLLRAYELSDISQNPDGQHFMIDAYIAVLSIDNSQENGGKWDVRKSVLDVTGTQDAAPDGRFTEHDLEKFVEELEKYKDSKPNWNREDLNGDGYTGGPHTARFDLTADSPPVFGKAEAMIEGRTVQFDETAVTDCQVLLYYAYGPFYEGDEDLRSDLLAPCMEVNVTGGYVVVRDIDADFLTEYPDESTSSWSGIHSAGFPKGDYAEVNFTGTTLTQTHEYLGNDGNYYTGSITINFDADFQNVLNFTAQATISKDDWIRNSSLSGQNIPIDSTDPYIIFKVKGPETCSKITGMAWSDYYSDSHTDTLLPGWTCNMDSELEIWVFTM